MVQLFSSYLSYWIFNFEISFFTRLMDKNMVHGNVCIPKWPSDITPLALELLRVPLLGQKKTPRSVPTFCPDFPFHFCHINTKEFHKIMTKSGILTTGSK